MPMPTSSDNNTNATDFYDGPYESYKTSTTPISNILNDTFEKLHYGLTLNNHDSLFNL